MTDGSGNVDKPNAPETPKSEMDLNPYSTASDRFRSRLCAMTRTTPVLLHVLQLVGTTSKAKLDWFLKEHGTGSKPGEYTVAADRGTQLIRLLREVEDAEITLVSLPRTTLVGIVSEFDVLVGSLIAAMLRDKPEMLKASERSLTFADLVGFGDIGAARDYLVEKQVESVLRDSHTDQFQWLEARLGMPLRNGLNSWPKFIELTERRNLLVHSDGAVSSQYLEACRRHGAPVDKGIGVGTRLRVDWAYLVEARDVLLEIGTKLAQVIWRKMRPGELDQAESHLISSTFELISQSLNNPTVAILEFFVEELKKKWTSGENRMICTVNLAQAFKWTKKPDRVKRLLSGLEEAILAPKFQIGFFVLRDEFDNASNAMISMGSKGPIKREDYRDWPLFKEFRKTTQFKSAFKEVFGLEFDEYVAETRKIDQALEDEGHRVLDEMRKLTDGAKPSAPAPPQLDSKPGSQPPPSPPPSNGKTGTDDRPEGPPDSI